MSMTTIVSLKTLLILKEKAIIINKNKFFTYDQVFKQSKILSDKVSKEKS